MTPFAQRKLNSAIEHTLRDAGLSGPPVRLKDVLDHLELYQEYYDLSDPGFLEKTKHKLQIGGRKLVEIIQKIKLNAVLFFDEKRVIIDRSLPILRREWPGFHEAGHRICPGHREVFAFGDTAQTLRPDYHEQLEAEANFVGEGVMFCGKRFTEEARDTTPCWETIDALAERYERTKTTALRRYTGFGPNRMMASMLVTPQWKLDSVHPPGTGRRFVRSADFATQFSRVGVNDLVQLVNSSDSRIGSLAAEQVVLTDDNDDHHEFLVEAYFNSYDLLTIFVHQRKLNMRGRIVVPQEITTNF